jgi:hypothetical protein
MSLISTHSQAQMAYEPTLWAKIFHSAPHVNITFHHVDPTFNPENDLYLESLGILASVPAAWLITTLVVLLIYLCTRCCDTKSTKHRKSRPIRCILSFFALVTAAGLAGGFYGNHVLHGGVIEFEKATEEINNIVRRVQEMSRTYNDVLQKHIEQNMNKLYDGPFQRDIQNSAESHLKIMDNSNEIFKNITVGLEAMDDIRLTVNNPQKRIDLRHIPLWSSIVERYRWPVTMALQGLFTLFCLLLFVGAIVHSRCVLILFSVCGLFSIIFLWLLASVYTTASVALADFCHDPTPWVMHIMQDKISKDISSYYLQCAIGRENPFERPIADSERAITDIDIRVRQISTIARQHYSQSELVALDVLEQKTEETIRLMGDLKNQLRCEPIFRSYSTALVAVCDSGLLGLIILLISSAISGFLFTTLVWCNSHTWIYFKHKGRYIKVDDQDPYMPLSTIERPRMTSQALGPSPGSISGVGTYSQHRGPRTMHTPPQTPPYHGTLNGHSALGPSHLAYGASGGAPGHHPAHAATLGHGHGSHGHHLPHHAKPSMSNIGTLGRNSQQHSAYRGMDNLPATMTLGRRGHYASLRGGGHSTVRLGGTEATDALMAGHNHGQYATLSKQCKTLESSDFY